MLNPQMLSLKPHLYSMRSDLHLELFRSSTHEAKSQIPPALRFAKTTFSQNFHSSLTTFKELTQAVTKPSQSNITSAKRQQRVQKWKWESAFICIYFSPSSAEHRNRSSSKTKGGNPPPQERTCLPL